MIAISAKKRHGKDTVADYICASRGYTKYALASPFKNSIVEFSYGIITDDMIQGNGYDREQKFFFNGDHVAEMYKSILCHFGYHASIYTVNWEPIRSKNEWSVRELMQTIGTDIGCDQVDRLIWMHPLAKMVHNTTKIVVSDCRQEHEMELMRKFGATVIHVINPYIENSDTHITERGLEIQPDDYVISNPFNPKWNDEEKQQSLLNLHHIIEEVLCELGL